MATYADLPTDKEINDIITIYPYGRDIMQKKILDLWEWSDRHAQIFLMHIKENSPLQILKLISCNIDDNGANMIGRVIKKNTTLTLLDISENNVNDIGATYIGEALKINTTLKQ